VTTLVIGGHARKVGKTSIVAGLIAAFSHRPWTAVKISSHRHSDSSDSGGYEIFRETDPWGNSDSSRYLAAGASTSIWMQAEEESYDAAMQQLLPIIRSSPFLIVESNRILNFIEPDLCLMALRYDIEDFKDSAREMIMKAHALIAASSALPYPVWKGVLPEALTRVPIFSAANFQQLPDGLLDFVKARCPDL
jgi:hypothetical protein